MRPHAHALGLALLVAATSARATDPSAAPPPSLRLSAEVDPIPFFEHGFSVHAAVKPLDHLRFTLGAFGLRLPDPAAGSTNAGWQARQLALEASGSYFFVDAKVVGIFGGLYVFAQRWTYERSDTAGEATSFWITPAPAVGLQCLPWGRGFYFVPWAAAGIPLRGEAPQLAQRTYEEPKVFLVLAVHVGFEFSVN
jgi:hypothetical protein